MHFLQLAFTSRTLQALGIYIQVFDLTDAMMFLYVTIYIYVSELLY